MYYLLENNRIIDENRALHNVDEIIIEENENEKYLYLVGWLGKHFCGNIKKQSENVYDLIEVGDLVRYKTNCLEIEHLYAIENLYEDFVDYAKRGCYNILAIYKPNEKGDYIKVWEAKND